jgi:predicted DsbA family dithiol-disulfide isomerase
MGKASPWEWPVTTLPALEAVQAAALQSSRAAEELDLALRRALFADNRCVSMRHVILEVAGGCGSVDVGALADALDDGRARRAVVDAWREAERRDDIEGSPHVFLPDGSDHHNPGIETHTADGMPVVDGDEPSIYDKLMG